jgi:hypothetical protein
MSFCFAKIARFFLIQFYRNLRNRVIVFNLVNAINKKKQYCENKNSFDRKYRKK